MTARGLQKAGLIGSPASADSTQPLFFVPPEVIADWPIKAPANVIGQRRRSGVSFAASQSQNPATEASSPGITWESIGSHTNQRESSAYPCVGQSSGGKIVPNDTSATGPRAAQPAAEATVLEAARSVPILPDTEAARSLAAINVLPDQVAELAHTPLTVVNDAIRDGHARPYVRDLAGWVVTLIRAHRDHGWKIAPPAPRHDSPEALREAFGRYAAEQAAECHEDMDDDSPALPLPVPAQLADHEARIRLWNDVLSTLKFQLTRQEFTTWIRPATLHAIAGGMATIVVPNVRVKEAIEGNYRAPLRDLLTMHVGEPIMVQVILDGAHDHRPATSLVCNQVGTAIAAANPPCIPDSAPNNRPDWIRTERWETLPVMLRAVLIGSTVGDGQVHAVSPYLDQLLQGRYAEIVAALVTE